MRSYLKNILFFLLPILILAFPLDLLTSKLLLEEDHIEFANGELNTWNYIYSEEKKMDLLIYGSSRAWVHIDPNIIEEKTGFSSFNFGIDGHNFELQNLRHRENLKVHGYPKYIIYSVDLFTLAKRPDLFNSEQFLPFMFRNEDISKTLLEYEGFYPSDFYIPMARYFGKKQTWDQLFLRNPNTKRELGYRGFDLEWNNDFKTAKENKGSMNVELDSASMLEFEKLIDELTQNNVKVCLVYTPEYYEAQGFVKNRSEIIQWYLEIASKKNIIFLDYSDSSISQNKTLFYNGSHMNKTGAELFTRTLVDDLKTKHWLN